MKAKPLFEEESITIETFKNSYIKKPKVESMEISLKRAKRKQRKIDKTIEHNLKEIYNQFNL